MASRQLVKPNPDQTECSICGQTCWGEQHVHDYTTHDLHLAAYLVALRHRLRRLDGGDRKEFVFDADAREAAVQFHDNALVGVLDFATALRQVKARLYAG